MTQCLCVNQTRVCTSHVLPSCLSLGRRTTMCLWRRCGWCRGWRGTGCTLDEGHRDSVEQVTVRRGRGFCFYIKFHQSMVGSSLKAPGSRPAIRGFWFLSSEERKWLALCTLLASNMKVPFNFRYSEKWHSDHQYLYLSPTYLIYV